MLKTTLLTTLLTAATLAAPTAASADIGIKGSASISIGTLPHAPMHITNRAIPGYVWVNGHWAMVRGNVYWSPGYYVPAKAGFVYQQPHWVTLRNGRSKFKKGRWIKDRRGYEYRPGRYVYRSGREVWVAGGFVRKAPVNKRHIVNRRSNSRAPYFARTPNRRVPVIAKKPKRVRDYRKVRKYKTREARKNLAFNH